MSSDDDRRPWLDPATQQNTVYGSVEGFVESVDYDDEKLRALAGDDGDDGDDSDPTHKCQICGEPHYIEDGTTHEYSWCGYCEKVTRHKDLDAT